MKDSVWNDYLLFTDRNKRTAPVVFSTLRQLKPVEFLDDKLVLSCDGVGIKLYLEKKIGIVEQSLSNFFKKPIIVEIVVVIKKKKIDTPLLSFQPSLEDVFIRSGLHAKYRFDNFAVSSTNQVAFAAAQAVEKNPGSAYNPLFLYGGVGVGKTHLAQAIARKVLEENNEKRVFFCPGDQFTNELIESIREHSSQRFRKKYRALFLLIVDDIQFIAGKVAVQEEFFHTFNSIVSVGGQVILTSDRPPSEIKNLEDRLRSRFLGGLIVDIQPPDFELRTAILLNKAKEKSIEIDIEAAKVIAEQVSDSRGLEGALLSVYAKTLGRKEKVDLESVELFFQGKEISTHKKISTHDVLRAVCSYYNIRQTHIKGPQRDGGVIIPRQVVMFILRNELRLTLEEIAYILKRKDHTTIIHGVNKISSLITHNPLIKQEVDRIVSSLALST